MAVEFIYFDLGNVLLTFDHSVMVKQLAELFQTSQADMYAHVIGGDLQEAYESGRVSNAQFYEALCEFSGIRPHIDDALHAASAIFAVNEPVLPILRQLRNAGHRLGILSNTCDAHWNYVLREFSIAQPYFEKFILSYEVGAMKPLRRIYDCAVEVAGVNAKEVFFTDDRADNVQGAVDCGIDAVQFIDANQLLDDLAKRGILLDPSS